MEWVGKINDALKEDRFILYFQKILPFNEDNTEENFEVLLRMIGEEGEEISPMKFIPSAERYNLMPLIDRWVIENTFRKMKSFRDKRKYHVSINISGQSLGDDEFLKFVNTTFKEIEMPSSLVCFEITETAAISNFPQALHFIQVLRQNGCKFSLDDFGSGLSSFGYLKNLAVDYLKIDGSFVRDIIADATDRAMVQAIISIGHTMNIKTIAEFVENDEVADMLRNMGVDYGQGYGLHRPEPL